MTSIRIISIGYEREFLYAESPASERLSRMVSAEFPMSIFVISRGNDAIREAPHTRVFGFSGNGLIRFWKAFRLIVREVKQARRDGEQVVVSAQDPMIAGLLAFKISRWMNVPYEVQEHGDFFSGAWERERPVWNRYLARLGGFVIRRADCVRAVTERVKNHLIQRFGIEADRIYIKPVDLDVSWHLGLQKSSHSGDPVIVMPCRFVEQKGIEVALRALADVASRGVPFHLRLIGKGPLEARIRMRIAELGIQDRVSIKPWASQESIWNDADLFLLSSNYEGFGRTIVEAMAARVPVVTMDAGCVGSIFRPQVDGRVVPVGNSKALADAIVEQCTEHNRRDWMVTQAFDRAKSFMSEQYKSAELQKQAWNQTTDPARNASQVSNIFEPNDKGSACVAGGHELRATNRSGWKWTALMMTFAIAIHGLSFALFWGSLGPHREWGFFTLVQNWFLGNGYSYVSAPGCASAYRSPGYLFILTVIYGLFGFANFFAQALIQNIVAVILVYAVYRLATELFNDRRIGWIAGLIVTVHPYSFYHYTQYYHTVFSSLFIVLLLYALLKTKKTKRFSWAIVSGIWIAALAYVTGTILAATPFLALWLFISLRKEWKQAILLVLTMAVVSAGLISPWTIRNWKVFHAFVPLTTDLGYATAKGYNDHVYYYNLLGYPQEAYQATPLPGNPLMTTFSMLPEVAEDMKAHGYTIPKGYFLDETHPLEPNERFTCEEQRQMNEVEFGHYWSNLSSQWLKTHYWTIGWKIQLQKIEEFWSPVLQPTKRYGAAWSFGNEGILATLAKDALIVYVSALEVFAIIGVVFIAKRKRLWNIVPSLVLFVVYTVMYSLFVGYTKYRIPLDGLLAVIVAFAVVAIWDWFRRPPTINQ